MEGEKRIAVLREEFPGEQAPDERDTLREVEAVSQSLRKLGYETVEVAVSLDLAQTIARIHRSRPFILFNLAESLGGESRFIHLVPSILEHIGIPFTGADERAMYLTTNKPLSKQLMLLFGIETPAWQTAREVRREGLKIRAPLIVKPVWEDGSRGIGEESVFYSEEECVERIEQVDSTAPGTFFVEAFVDGREVGVSLLADRGKPETLPPSEIVFTDFPVGKPRIVDYEAKWNPESLAGANTPRSFDFGDEDRVLTRRLKALAGKCWNCFGLRGYARVDFRIDKRNKPWVIEVNANPCVSPDSGFVAAAIAAGYTYEGIITRIIDHAYLDSMFRGGQH